MLQTIARLLGWQPSRTAPAQSSGSALAAAPPPGLAVARGGDLGMPAPLFDAAALGDRNRARALDIARRNAQPSGWSPAAGNSCP
jgi:hypothetical protein